MLQTNPESEERLNKVLWFPSEETTYVDKTKQSNAIITFLQFPQNSLLGLEIAKTLYFRRKFLEANEILRIILSTDPLNLTARTLRIAIFWNLGLDETLPYSVSEIYFLRAEMEAAYIEKNSFNMDEDFYCEHAYSKLANALRILRLLRENGGEYTGKDMTLTMEEVFELLDKSERIFMKGVTASSTGHRSLFILLCVHSFKEMLKKDEKFLKNPNKKLLDKGNVCRETAKDIFLLANWLRHDYEEEKKQEFFRKRFENAARLHNDSVVLRTRRPNIIFTFAVLFFDFCPIMTVGTVKKVLELLRSASGMARLLGKDEVCLGSMTRFSAELMPNSVFITHIQEAINQIESRVGRLEDLEERMEAELIDESMVGGLKLFCSNI